MLSRASSRILGRSNGILAQQFRFCSAATTEAAAAVPAEVKDDSNAAKGKRPRGEPKYNWTYVVGFSPYASRRDLELVLGQFKPTRIEPMVSISHIFSGSYGFKFATPDEHIEFRKFINTPDAIRNKSATLKVFEESWFDSDKLLHASAVDISPCTLRCHVGQQSVTTDHLVGFFENFDVKHENVKKYPNPHSRFHYLVHFKSPEEAERAAIENNDKEFHRGKISLSTYQC